MLIYKKSFICPKGETRMKPKRVSSKISQLTFLNIRLFVRNRNNGATLRTSGHPQLNQPLRPLSYSVSSKRSNWLKKRQAFFLTRPMGEGEISLDSTATVTKRTKRFHTRSRAGCVTCRQRHLRCDENFPIW